MGLPGGPRLGRTMLPTYFLLEMSPSHHLLAGPQSNFTQRKLAIPEVRDPHRQAAVRAPVVPCPLSRPWVSIADEQCPHHHHGPQCQPRRRATVAFPGASPRP